MFPLCLLEFSPGSLTTLISFSKIAFRCESPCPEFSQPPARRQMEIVTSLKARLHVLGQRLHPTSDPNHKS